MGAKKLNYSVCIDAVFRESKLSFVEGNRTKDSSFLYGVY